MMAMATEKMGIMELSDGVHTAAAMAMEKIEFFSPFHCRSWSMFHLFTL